MAPIIILISKTIDGTSGINLMVAKNPNILITNNMGESILINPIMIETKPNMYKTEPTIIYLIIL